MKAETAENIKERLEFIAKKTIAGKAFIKKYGMTPVENEAGITALYPEREKVLRYFQSDIKGMIKLISSELNLRKKIFQELNDIYNDLKTMEDTEINVASMNTFQVLIERINTAKEKTKTYFASAEF